jgi:small subunit ribosomal protein S12
MATLQQLLKNRRKTKKKKIRRISLESCPQKRGTIIKPTTKAQPRKPNSALRSIMRVRLTSNRHEITAFIPGEKHSLQPHNHVLIRGGRVKDIPGLKYIGIRGTLDLFGVINRKTARTKYGVKLLPEEIKKSKRPFTRKLL